MHESAPSRFDMDSPALPQTGEGFTPPRGWKAPPAGRKLPHHLALLVALEVPVLLAQSFMTLGQGLVLAMLVGVLGIAMLAYDHRSASTGHVMLVSSPGRPSAILYVGDYTLSPLDKVADVQPGVRARASGAIGASGGHVVLAAVKGGELFWPALTQGQIADGEDVEIVALVGDRLWIVPAKRPLRSTTAMSPQEEAGQR